MQAGIHRKDISSVKSQIFDQTRDVLFKIQAIAQIGALLLCRNNTGHCKIHSGFQGLVPTRFPFKRAPSRMLANTSPAPWKVPFTTLENAW